MNKVVQELKKVKDMDAANAFLKAHDCDATAKELSELHNLP